MNRGSYYTVLRFRERDPPSHIVPGATFRAYEDHLVDIPSGFDREVFTGIQFEK